MASPADQIKAQTQASEPTGHDIYKNTVNDLRSSLVCRVCFRLLCEPFTITCGHTFCYECLNQWFKSNKHKKTCPGCRAGVNHMPAQSYSIRDMVSVLSKDQRLLPPGDDLSEYERVREEMTALLEKHRRSGEGLFEGSFNVSERPRPIWDGETLLWHCPDDGHEIVDGICSACGINYDHPSDEYDDSDSESTTSFSGEIPGHPALELEAEEESIEQRVGRADSLLMSHRQNIARAHAQVSRLERQYRHDRQLSSQFGLPLDIQRQHNRAHARSMVPQRIFPLVVPQSDSEEDEEDYSDGTQDDISDLIDDGSVNTESAPDADDFSRDGDLSDTDEDGEVDYGEEEDDENDNEDVHALIQPGIRQENDPYINFNTPEPRSEIDSPGTPLIHGTLEVNNFSDSEHGSVNALELSCETDSTDDEGSSISESSHPKSSPATHANAASSDGEDDIVFRQPRSRKRTRTVVSSDSDDENASHRSERPSRQRRKAVETIEDSSDEEEDDKDNNEGQAKANTGAPSVSQRPKPIAASTAVLRAVSVSSDEDEDPIPANRSRARQISMLVRRPSHDVSQPSGRQERDGIPSASRARITSGARA